MTLSDLCASLSGEVEGAPQNFPTGDTHTSVERRTDRREERACWNCRLWREAFGGIGVCVADAQELPNVPSVDEIIDVLHHGTCDACARWREYDG